MAICAAPVWANDQGPDGQVRDVVIPASLLRAPGRFGGNPQDGCLRGDLIIKDGRAVAIAPAPPGPAPRLIMPWLTEAHCHLDKCHTSARIGPHAGDLAAAIAAQSADKVHWTAQDLRSRMARGLAEADAAGVRRLRTHIDWGDGTDPPLAWDIFSEAGSDIALDRAALVNIAALADPDLGPAIAARVAAGGGTLGTFVLDQAERAAGVRAAFDLAQRYGLALDFHVDESLDPACDGLDLIAETALAMRFAGPVLCGHACALATRQGPDLDRLLEKLAKTTIAVTALPWTNLWLQGRGQGTPHPRGLTRMRELRAAGVPVVVGSDNVADAFCPTGRHDPMAALGLATLAGHLDLPLADWLPAITTDAARALGHTPDHIDNTGIEDLCLMDGDVGAALAGRAGPPRPLSEYLKGPEHEN